MNAKHLYSVVEAFLNNDEDKASAAFAAYFADNMKSFMKEDHEQVLTAPQLSAYITALLDKVHETNKEDGLKLLGIKDCEHGSIALCAADLAKDKKKADKIIHKLEKLVGADPKVEKKLDKKTPK
jgi:hypothetical protein